MESNTLFGRFGIKWTKKRQAVLDVFLSDSSPLSSVEVNDHLQKKQGSIDRATVFRILNTFSSAGLLNKLEFNEGMARYELSLNAHHHHMVCVTCGTVACVELCDVGAVQKSVEQETGFTVVSHRLEFFGICPSCTPLP